MTDVTANGVGPLDYASPPKRRRSGLGVLARIVGVVVIAHHVEETAIDVDRAAGQGEGVDLPGIENLEGVWHIAFVHVRDEADTDAADPFGVRRVGIDSKLLLHLPCALLAQANLLLGGEKAFGAAPGQGTQ